MLILRDVVVQYPGGPRALEHLSLTVPPGIFGLLGPNGAGKSTLLRVLATLQRPDAGTVTAHGLDVQRDAQQWRAQLGYLPQDFGVYPTLTVREMLAHFCVLKGATPGEVCDEWVQTLLARTNLSAKQGARTSTLSGGMRQRLGLAIALAGAPKLLVLDEPTAGLDPGERRRMYHVLQALAADVIVVLSTHLTDDVRAICQRFAILHEGRIRLEGTPTEALAQRRQFSEPNAPDATFDDVYFSVVNPADTP